MAPMVINPRVSVLVLVVGSFMGLWSQDAQPSAESVVAAAFAKRDALYAGGYESDLTTTTETIPDSEPGIPAMSVARTGSSLSLPDYIAPGHYRAVNHDGAVHVVEVLEPAANRNASARDFYTHEINNDRWYLIKLDQTAVAIFRKSALQ